MKLLESIKKEIRQRFIFLNACTSVIGNDIYFCTCGETLEKAPDTEFELEMSYEDYLTIDFVDIARMTKKTNLKCTNCNADYSKPETFSKIKNTNQKFIEKFFLENDNEKTILHKARFWATENLDKKISIENDLVSIGISNEGRKVFFKEYDESNLREIDLGEVVQKVNSFFESHVETEVTEDFIHVHSFIGLISPSVSDAQNIDIANELMSEIKFDAGTDILKKIISAFLGIVLYPNLSTIAISKGAKFLFDMMRSCPLPSTEYMKKSGATSPLKIFNHLVNLKNKQLQKELDMDDTNKMGYKFVNENGKEFLIKYDSKRFQEKDLKTKKISNKVFVRDQIIERQISPYIFNKINKFSDYENLMKFLRFVSYEQLIQLCMKYDKDFLTESYKLFEFRFDVDYQRIIQFLSLIEYFCRDLDINKQRGFNLQYVAKYDFNIYDDCQRMLTELNWDFNRVFYKIKKHAKLLEFHDDLLRYRSYLNDKEINEKYVSFSEKWKYLEDYKGNISVKVIDTPEKLLNKAKEMKNCAASYVRRVALGEYIAFTVYDKSKERKPEEFYEYMMVLELGKYGLEFIGVKGPCNIYGSDRFKNEVKSYLEKMDISYKEVPSIRLGVNNQN